MLSGNGRHRRPRQAPALVVAAGVTGSAIAIPLLGATGAHAADGANWDRVAECETGGAWSQNSGNGYYGGLQLSQEAWEQYGGLEYAPSADEASRSQQIRIAEKIHADQGIAAWPTCGLLAGLGNDSGALGGDGAGSTGDGSSEGGDTSQAPTAPRTGDPSGSTGTADASRPADPTGTTDPAGSGEASGSSPSASPSGTPDATSTGKGETSKSDTSAESDASASVGSQESGSPSTGTTKNDETDKVGQSDGTSAAGAESGAGRHRGDSADEGAESGRTDASSGRHASRGAGDAREAVEGSYTVRSGDSLWGIADSLDLDGGWRSLYAGNKEVVGADPDHILPGQTLTVTGESGEK
ncbi:transglycosylase family protein [Streptomyces sp. A144]|uniref:transglycosylase family protein n=1 Tax=Streptomyces sp. A144 TaxID=2871487 RepID=UPI001CBAB8BD|nr:MULTISPECIES: transglycosylase family protein [Streptomyces]UAX54241.1 transglycosylase family protein [Streptomyces sp. A144]WMI58921.1 transglycosylase family protein [Streptomyces rochei]